LLLPLEEKEKGKKRYNEERRISYSFGIVREARVCSAGEYKEWVRCVGVYEIDWITEDLCFNTELSRFSRLHKLFKRDVSILLPYTLTSAYQLVQVYPTEVNPRPRLRGKL